ncbi:MAG: outer membrane protein assembly factor BamE [Rhizobiaceae bacterium]|nr:outer membrane protein assembly factor BamE [Rhizobiaceae bacterium]
MAVRLHRRRSWFTAFRRRCKRGGRGSCCSKSEVDLLSGAFDFKFRRFATVAGAAVLGLAAAGCNATDSLSTSETISKGYVIDESSLELVPVGSSREQVLLTLGTPSTTATFDNEVFYYISQTRVRRVAFANAQVVDQRVLAVYFGDDGRVTNIANYGLQDGKLFDFISRTTPTAGKDQNFLIQLISGVAGGGGTPSRLPGL